jgi:hypothetical protein
MSERLPSVRIDCDFYSKPRNRKWVQQHGADGIIILQMIWLAAAGGKLRKDEVSVLPYPLIYSEEKICTVIEAAIHSGLLEEDEDHYFNSKDQKDLERLTEKRDGYRKGWAKRKNHDETILKPERNQDKPSLVYKEQEQEPGTGTRNPEDLDLKKQLARLSPELQAEIPKWIEHRAAKKKPLGFSEIDAILMDAGRDPGGLLRSMRTSRRNGHMTLYAVSEATEQRQSKNGKAAHYDAVIELVRKHGRNGWGAAEKALPTEVLAAVRRVGWRTFCEAKDGDQHLRARFLEALG